MKTIEEFKEYFKEDLDAIDAELIKQKEYSAIIDDEINKISCTMRAAGGVVKGGQHYLIEHIKNAVALQTQREGLRKDKFAIKRAIVDYATKNNPENQDNINFLDVINDMIQKQESYNDAELSATNQSGADDEIEKALENYSEEE